MTAQEQFAKLYQLLVEQEEVIDRLITAGKEQTNCLRENNVQGLQQIVQQQNALSSKFATLEKQRVQVQQVLEQELNITAGSSLQDLSLSASEELQARLRDSRSTLREKTRKLQEIITLNQTLTNQGLQFTGLMLNLLQPPTPDDTAYARDGRRKGKGRQQGMINKTI